MLLYSATKEQHTFNATFTASDLVRYRSASSLMRVERTLRKCKRDIGRLIINLSYTLMSVLDLPLG